MRGDFCYLGLGEDFLDMAPKVQSTKEKKLLNLVSIKFKRVMLQKKNTIKYIIKKWQSKKLQGSIPSLKQTLSWKKLSEESLLELGNVIKTC